MHQTKRHVLLDALARADWKYKEAAYDLGLNPKTMYCFLTKLNLRHLLNRQNI